MQALKPKLLEAPGKRSVFIVDTLYLALNAERVVVCGCPGSWVVLTRDWKSFDEEMKEMKKPPPAKEIVWREDIKDIEQLDKRLAQRVKALIAKEDAESKGLSEIPGDPTTAIREKLDAAPGEAVWACDDNAFFNFYTATGPRNYRKVAIKQDQAQGQAHRAVNFGTNEMWLRVATDGLDPEGGTFISPAEVKEKSPDCYVKLFAKDPVAEVKKAAERVKETGDVFVVRGSKFIFYVVWAQKAYVQVSTNLQGGSRCATEDMSAEEVAFSVKANFEIADIEQASFMAVDGVQDANVKKSLLEKLAPENHA